MSAGFMASEVKAEHAVKVLRSAIEAAENGNQAGENFVVIAAAGNVLAEALEQVSFRCPPYAGDLDDHSSPSDGWTPSEYAREFELFQIARIGDLARDALAKARGEAK